MSTALAKSQFKAALENPDMTATVLMAILLDRYGTEFLEWEPDTLRIQIADDYGANPPENNWDKIWACVMLLTTDLFYNSLEAFNSVCNALSGEGAHFDKWELAEPEEIMWGVAETTLLEPPEKGKKNHDFSHEIRQFVGLALAEFGIWRTPKLLLGIVEKPNLTEDATSINFSDDPAMHASFFNNQTAILADLEAGVHERLGMMYDQLQLLPFETASSEALQSFQLPGTQQLAAQ